MLAEITSLFHLRYNGVNNIVPLIFLVIKRKLIFSEVSVKRKNLNDFMRSIGKFLNIFKISIRLEITSRSGYNKNKQNKFETF